MENHNGNFGRLLKLKEKQLKDMSRQMKSKETEKMNKLASEKEDLINLSKLIAEEQLKNYFLKQHKNEREKLEYNEFLLRKQFNEYKQNEEKEKDKCLVGLTLNHEENLNQFKQKIEKLDDKMEKNIQLHNNYIKQHQIEKDHLSNLLKNIPSMLIYQNELKNSERQNDLKSEFTLNHLDQNSIVNRHYTNIDFEKKNQEDLNDYINAKKEIYNFNNKTIKYKDKDNSSELKQIQMQIRLDELEKKIQIDKDMRDLKISQQNIYKYTLDNQVKDRMFYSPQALKIKDNFLGPRDINEHSFLDRNTHVSVAPYSEKKYNIGGTILHHNPIINPVPNYKNNKYLYQHYSPFRYAGNGLIG